MSDINDYLGVPYVAGGRDRSGWDCYGLVKALYKDFLDVDLPDWYADASDILDTAKKMSYHEKTSARRGSASLVGEPMNWDIVLIARKRAAFHMGVFIHNGILHASEFIGTHFDDMPKFMMMFGQPELRFYRWHR